MLWQSMENLRQRGAAASLKAAVSRETGSAKRRACSGSTAALKHRLWRLSSQTPLMAVAEPHCGGSKYGDTHGWITLLGAPRSALVTNEVNMKHAWLQYRGVDHNLMNRPYITQVTTMIKKNTHIWVYQTQGPLCSNGNYQYRQNTATEWEE